MDEQTKKEALIMGFAGFLHGIGDLIKRADDDEIKALLTDKSGPDHALYTAAFIDWAANKIPSVFNDENAKVGGMTLRDLATASNHENPLELIIRKADALSVGADRSKTDESKAQQITIFEHIDLQNPLNSENKPFSPSYFYPLKPLSPQNIFPNPVNEKDSANQYRQILDGFKKQILKLPHKDNLTLWFEHFDGLFETYCSNVPSVMEDVSLYDCTKINSAFSAALYLFHKDNKTLDDLGAIEDEQTPKFLYLKTKFYGIQNFIFSQGGETHKNSAKILRGRSFYISLLMELAADMLCENTGMPHTGIIMNAAGAITMILPNTDETKNAIRKTEEKINEWLLEYFYGEVSLGFPYVEASAEEIKNKLDDLGEEIAEKLEKNKFRKIDDKHLKVVESYCEDGKVLCHWCGKRPVAQKDVKCPICDDVIEIGEKLVKNDRILILNGNIEGNKLKTLIYGKYGLSFEASGEKDSWSEYIVKVWDLRSDDFTQITTSHKQFKAYVSTDDNGEVKDFGEIAKGEQGLDALGILKSDIDNLGLIFYEGISKRYRNTLAKQISFSRQVNYFFTIYLPHLFNEKYKKTYTVFAGGDDLFLIGRWDEIMDLAFDIREEFRKYSCKNPQVTFSSGISISKPKEPIRTLYRQAEDALEASKNFEEKYNELCGQPSDDSKKVKKKDSLTIFGETIRWDKAENFKDIDGELAEWIRKGDMNSAGLYKLLAFIDMATEEDKIKKEKGVGANLRDMENFKWRALLVYFLSRNEKLSNKDKIIEKFSGYITNKETRSLLKIALWKNIYLRRNNS